MNVCECKVCPHRRRAGFWFPNDLVWFVEPPAASRVKYCPPHCFTGWDGKREGIYVDGFGELAQVVDVYKKTHQRDEIRGNQPLAKYGIQQATTFTRL